MRLYSSYRELVVFLFFNRVAEHCSCSRVSDRGRQKENDQMQESGETFPLHVFMEIAHLPLHLALNVSKRQVVAQMSLRVANSNISQADHKQRGLKRKWALYTTAGLHNFIVTEIGGLFVCCHGKMLLLLAPADFTALLLQFFFFFFLFGQLVFVCSAEHCIDCISNK